MVSGDGAGDIQADFIKEVEHGELVIVALICVVYNREVEIIVTSLVYECVSFFEDTSVCVCVCVCVCVRACAFLSALASVFVRACALVCLNPTM